MKWCMFRRESASEPEPHRPRKVHSELRRVSHCVGRCLESMDVCEMGVCVCVCVAGWGWGVGKSLITE